MVRAKQVLHGNQGIHIQIGANYNEHVIGKHIFHIPFLPKSRKAERSLGMLPLAYGAKGGEGTGVYHKPPKLDGGYKNHVCNIVRGSAL